MPAVVTAMPARSRGVMTSPSTMMPAMTPTTGAPR